MRIELRSGGYAPPQWRVGLAERLEARGFAVVLARRAGPADEPGGTGLALLFMLERLLYGVATPF